MASIDIARQTIWEDGDATCMARVQLAGANVTQSVLASITLHAYDLDSATPTTDLLSPGTSLTIANVIFDTLQTDARWTEDTTGYNFRHGVAASQFTTPDHRYVLEYIFVGSSGEQFPVVFGLLTKGILSS